MLNQFSNIEKALINDINEDLMITYKTIATNPRELISILKISQYVFHYLNAKEKSKKEYYYPKRTLYNTQKFNKTTQPTLFIFINRTCINGLNRVNRIKEFNVQKGSYKKTNICDKENFLVVSEAQQKVEILCGDFKQTLNYEEQITLFYFAPPNKLLSETSCFISYAKDEFNDAEQIRLRNFYQKLNDLNHHWNLSNSDVIIKDQNSNFFDELFADYTIKRGKAKLNINANLEKSGELSELLMSNYQYQELYG